ncbi:MAG TPA: hypothetical protein VGD65_00300 [Chryseosolibacter sp.]
MKRAAVGFMLFLATFQSLAQKPSIVTSTEEGWQKIGETTVNFKEEDESIVVMGADEFSALKLKVTDAPIRIERVQVFYESGEMQELDVDTELLAGAETEGFQLDQKDRDIQKVAFTYRTTANTSGDKAHVELHGLKTDVREPSDAYRDRPDNTGVIDSLDGGAQEADSAVNQAGQELNDAAENIEDDVEDGAERITNDTLQNPQNNADEVMETAANAASGIADKKIENKVGPEGQSIYIDSDSKYYYINDEGKKVIIDKKQLKDKKLD